MVLTLKKSFKLIVSINKDSVFSLFGADSFNNLEIVLDNMSPSMVEYHLLDICNSNDEHLYFNKRDIENSFSFGDFSFYIDYDSNLYIEQSSSYDDCSTQSFW